jgi:hypothetical protein
MTRRKFRPSTRSFGGYLSHNVFLDYGRATG